MAPQENAPRATSSCVIVALVLLSHGSVWKHPGATVRSRLVRRLANSERSMYVACHSGALAPSASSRRQGAKSRRLFFRL